ncbi:restriction endonuclease subunit S [Stappia indica]|uniref:restriction endonuclease subunit S n=1 Tax=Stappia indica TaxID=538381 RepID=UPI00082C26B3|nr:restriction endonuclease subunit S [Stappia indica]
MVEVKRVRLGDVAYEHKERIGEEAPDRPVYGVDKSVGLTAEPRYQSSNLSRYKRIEHGMFAYNPMRLNIGSIGFCHADLAPGIVSPDYVVFGCRKGALLPKFMDYHTRSAPWSDWLSLAGEGSVRERIYFRKLETYELALPDVAYQEAAVEILSSLDNKIELNRRMNETLEALVQAIFKDWFVTFGPTRRKMGGATDPVAILGGLIPDPAKAAPLAALFPDSFGDDGLPEGWRIEPFESLAEITMGISPDGSTYNEAGIGIPLCNGPAEYGEFFLRKIKWTTAPNKLSKPGDLIICVRGSTTGRHAFADAEYCLGRGVASIRGRDDDQEFVETALLHDLDRLLQKTTGSVFPSLSATDIKKFEVTAPSRSIRQAFVSTMRPVRNKIWSSIQENQLLAATRDHLLPKLMTGAVRLQVAEAMAE